MSAVARQDHSAVAVDRLSLQYRDKPKFEAVLKAFAEQVQEAEDALLQVLMARDLDTATGKQLEEVGAIVGQLRGALGDELYRTYIRVRIKVNNSTGTAPELVDIFRLLVPSGGQVAVTDEGPAELRVALWGNVVSNELAEVYVLFLTLAKAGGVDARFNWQPQEEAETFTLDGGPGLGLGDTEDPDVGGGLIGEIRS